MLIPSRLRSWACGQNAANDAVGRLPCHLSVSRFGVIPEFKPDASAFLGTNPVIPECSRRRSITAMILLSLLLGVICRNDRPIAQAPKPLRSGVTITVPVEVVSNSRNAVWYGQNRPSQG